MSLRHTGFDVGPMSFGVQTAHNRLCRLHNGSSNTYSFHVRLKNA